MNLAYGSLASLVVHLGLLAALYFAFDRAPELLQTQRGRASVQLVASVASSGEQAKPDLEVRIETPRPPVEPRAELEPATMELARRPPDMPNDRALGDLPMPLPEPATERSQAMKSEREVVEVAIEFTPKPLPREERERPEPTTEAEAMASVASPASQAVDGAEVDELPFRQPSNRAPAYPADALAAGQQGMVTLSVKLTAAGTVSDLSVHVTSGVASLDSAALTAVRAWRFSPARRRGTAVPFEVLVPVRFSIRGR